MASMAVLRLTYSASNCGLTEPMLEYLFIHTCRSWWQTTLLVSHSVSHSVSGRHSQATAHHLSTAHLMLLLACESSKSIMFQKLEANIPRLGDSTEAPAEHWHATEVPIGSLVECRAQAPFGYKHEFSWQCYVQDIHLCVVSAGHGVSLGSYEYLVYEKVFVAVAAEFGLQPVTSYAADTEGFQAQYHDQRPLHDLLQQVSCCQLAAYCCESLPIRTSVLLCICAHYVHLSYEKYSD